MSSHKLNRRGRAERRKQHAAKKHAESRKRKRRKHHEKLKEHVTADSLWLAILSGVLLILSFPKFEMWPLAWFALIPLFFAIQHKDPYDAFVLGYTTGFVFFIGSIYWLIHVTLPGYLLLCSYLAIYFGFFAFYSCMVLTVKRRALLYIPATWVALEFLRSSFALGFGWSLLAYSQYKMLPLIQVADITGAYGISFLIVMANVAIFTFITSTKKAPSVREKFFLVYHSPFVIVLVLLAFTYGWFWLNVNLPGKKMNVAVIQGNIPQDKKWDESYSNAIYKRYYELTRLANKKKLDLIVWPETSFPGLFGEDRVLEKRVQGVARRMNAPLLFGAPSTHIGSHGQDVTNSAVLFDSRGELVNIYDKLHLVPFGEYVPFEKLLGFVHLFARYPIAGFTPGSEYTVFMLPSVRNMVYESYGNFSVLICFEDVFPALSRRFVRGGASFLVNITNDAWFKDSAAPYQHVQASVFRAIENRVNVIRSANTGVSCFIDPTGRITSRVKDDLGRDTFIEGADTETIKIARIVSVYNEYGDLFAYGCLFIFIVYLVIGAPPPFNKILR